MGTHAASMDLRRDGRVQLSRGGIEDRCVKEVLKEGARKGFSRAQRGHNGVYVGSQKIARTMMRYSRTIEALGDKENEGGG